MPAASIATPSAPPRATSSRASGLRWLSAQLLVRGSLGPTHHGAALSHPARALQDCFYAGKRRPPKTLIDWARQAALQIHRWLPADRNIVMVADNAFAAIDLLAAVRRHLCLVTRLRLDASLLRHPSTQAARPGTPAAQGTAVAQAQPSCSTLYNTVWQPHTVALWYGRTNRLVEIASHTAIWYHPGKPPVPICWLIVRDPTGELETSGLPRHRPRCPADRHPPVVCLALAGRGHLPGNTRPSRRRNATTVVRSRHPAHHTGALSASSLSSPCGHTIIAACSDPHTTRHRMVSKSPPYILRRHRRRPTQNLGATDILNVPDPRRDNQYSTKTSGNA